MIFWRLPEQNIFKPFSVIFDGHEGEIALVELGGEKPQRPISIRPILGLNMHRRARFE